MDNSTQWWKEAVFYQIYPRSFNDSNGDGIGDIPGIMEKIPYLKQLGIDGIWLNPVYPSPNRDYGYDISDYRNIHPDYGSMDDFTVLLEECHAQGIKVIMDLVVNHTSTEHAWFQSSRKDPDGPYGNFYIWRDGEGAGPPNNWNSFFGGSAWKYDSSRGQYYLHLFDEQQADLNWSSPEVRDEVYRIMEWWFSRGIDGFRMDVINMISKDPRFPNDTRELDPLAVRGTPYFMNGPHLHTYLKEMRQKALREENKFAVGECPGAKFEDVLRLTGYDRGELDAVFQMELMEIDHGPGGKWDIRPWTAAEFSDRLTLWQTGLEGKAWPANFFANHDQPRPVSRFGNTENFHFESASMLAALLLSLTGTPFIYYGEEIGMPNADYTSIKEYRDVDTINFFELEREHGKPSEQLMQTIRYMSRDNARSPMQWNSEEYGGFSEQEPWIPLGRRYQQVNVQRDRASDRSVFEEYRTLIALRKKTPALMHGSFQQIKTESDDVLAFKKQYREEEYLVYANMAARDIQTRLALESDTADVEIVYTNYGRATAEAKKEHLRPYEACIFRVVGDSNK
ncbi:MAG: glycoside hydrolase family 13 protein [Spirochaetia bacterium]